MKIEGQAWGRSSYVKNQTVETKQAGKFSDALAAQPRQDTLTILYRPPVEETVPAQAETAVASGPLPADVVQAKRQEAELSGGLLSLFYREVAGGKADRALETSVVIDMFPSSTASSEVRAKLAELREAAANADYTGMSYGEIGTAIWERYNAAFGGNMPAITTFFGPPDWVDINNQFVVEFEHMVTFPVEREIWKDTRLEPGDEGYDEYLYSQYGALNRMKDYNGMSVREKEQAILEKYAGKDTLLDFLNMQGELSHAGVLSNKMGGKGASEYLWAIGNHLPYAYFFDNVLNNTPISQRQWDRALYGQLDIHSFAAGLKEHMQHLSFSGFDFNVADVVTQGIDDLLAALERRDAAGQH